MCHERVHSALACLHSHRGAKLTVNGAILKVSKGGNLRIDVDAFRNYLQSLLKKVVGTKRGAKESDP